MGWTLSDAILVAKCYIFTLPVGTTWHILMNAHTRDMHVYDPMCIYATDMCVCVCVLHVCGMLCSRDDEGMDEGVDLFYEPS